MAEKIMMDALNRVWLDSTGTKILKSRPYEEETLTNGKIAEYVKGNYENILGYCKTWYDSVGVNNLVQANAAYQFKITSDGIIALDEAGSYNSNCVMATTVANVKSCLLVIRSAAISASGRYLILDNSSYQLNIGNGSLIYFAGTGVKINTVSRTYGTSAWTGLSIVVGTDFVYIYYYNTTPFTFKGFGKQGGGLAWTKEIVHCTCYNKLLTTYEEMYNYNALKQRYKF